MSKSVSRVLYQTVIYLGDASPHRSSHLPKKHRANVFFLMRCCSKWGLHEKDNYLPPSKLLPYYSTLAAKMRRFIFCCTILRVASTGSYPAPCPAEPGLSSCTAFRPGTRDRLTYSFISNFICAARNAAFNHNTGTGFSVMPSVIRTSGSDSESTFESA